MGKFKPFTKQDQERAYKLNPPCQKCSAKKVCKVQYGYKEKDWEYFCDACGHKWE